MKICFITDTIFSLGGIQRVLTVVANELSKEYEVDILCTDERITINKELYKLNDKVNIIIGNTKNKDSIFSKGVNKIVRDVNKYTNVFNNNITEKLLLNATCNKFLKKYIVKHINKNNYDVVVGVANYYSILLGSISDELNCKTIGWQHNSYDAYLNNKYKYCWNLDTIFEKYIKKLDRYIVLTDDDKKKLFSERNISSYVIYNPLSFKSEKKSKCLNKNILFVGRLVEEQKGLDLLIKAFKKVSKKRKDWTLTIVGDGNDKDKLVNLIKNENLSSLVKIEPFTSNVEKYYLNSSILVSTSRWEGFGLVITEAMESGLPVISFENSGPKEIINKNGVNGILVPKEDIDKLAEQIIYLINNKDIRINMSREAIKRADDFNVDNIIKHWNKILRDYIIY